MEYRLVAFGVDAGAPGRDLARLHLALLPASPIALLGPRFMEDFYYRVLPREGLVFGAVAYVDQQPAGFIAATHDRAGFMRTAVKRRWPRLMWVIGGSVLTAPKSLGAVWQAWQVMSSRRPAAGAASIHGGPAHWRRGQCEQCRGQAVLLGARMDTSPQLRPGLGACGRRVRVANNGIARPVVAQGGRAAHRRLRGDMGKALVLAGLTVGLIVGDTFSGSAQVGDIHAKEQAYYDRVTSLKAQIAQGWTPAQVVAVMGEPERLGSYADGSHLVDIWGYRGYEVIIEFRNGLVSNWFFRFLP